MYLYREYLYLIWGIRTLPKGCEFISTQVSDISFFFSRYSVDILLFSNCPDPPAVITSFFQPPGEVLANPDFCHYNALVSKQVQIRGYVCVAKNILRTRNVTGPAPR